MGLNFNSINQRPYITRDNRNLVKQKREEDANKTLTQAEQEERAGSEARSRGLQYTQESANGITPAQSQRAQQLYRQYAGSAGRLGGSSTLPQTSADTKTSEYNTRSASINIAQIIKDFKNTAIAIGTPEDLNTEVNNRISLIQAELSQENPDINLVKSDLMNASRKLDKYISATLNKDSKVVENWMAALFLQDIDFNYNENNINPQFLVKFPEGSTEKIQKAEQTPLPENVTEMEVSSGVVEISEDNSEQTQTKVYIPEDKELKSMFLQSKRLAYAKEPEKAIANFKKALERAEEIGDTETGAKIYYEVGKIYDDHNFYPQALTSYNKSLENTTDNNVKTKAHYYMGRIYDDVNQIKPALDHYYCSVAWGGESENLTAQTTSLTKMGNIYTDMYEQDALDYLTIAEDLAAETDNSKVKGYVSSSLAKAYDKFGEPQEALKSYSKAVKHYSDADSPIKVAQNYIDAAEVMLEYNCDNKAKGLLQKAKSYADKTGDKDLIEQINTKLAEISQQQTPQTPSKQQPWAYHITGSGEDDYIPVIAA